MFTRSVLSPWSLQHFTSQLQGRFRVNRPLVTCFLITLWVVNGPAALAGVHKHSDGVELDLPSETVRVQVWSDRIIRVTRGAQNATAPAKSLSVIARPAKTRWALTQDADWLVLKTDALQVRVDCQTGQVGFFDLSGRPVLQETGGPRDFPAALGANGVHQSFELAPTEKIYGLGQHQSGIWNYRGTTVHLQQVNMEVAIPVLVSSRGYGVLWDNPAVTDVDVGKTRADVLSWNSEAGKVVDYYFMLGPAADGVIQAYRTLTGQVPMMGRWAWGFWQCKERYASQEELTNVVARYRAMHVPIDGIIQDWRYWPEHSWGSDAFDPARYPDPAKMVRDLHAMHAHVLISVWPKFDVGVSNLAELASAGGVYPIVTKGFTGEPEKWYDAFSPVGRQIYWRQISRELFQYGLDGWWLDASEPELSGQWGEFRSFPTALGPGADVFNAYPLLHTTAVYAGQRAETDQKRVFILTRSAYAGQQRNAAVTWSGDIQGKWDVFAKQIPAGLNFSVSGIPYWNTDIGGFWGKNPADKDYQELFTRWFQFGAFCPMFRVHGTVAPKELWRWDEPTRKIWKDYVNLRYRLLPYIYSTSWQVASAGGTMMRPLIMDFPADPAAGEVGDQYLFGPDLMVCPVTQPGVAARDVYLPGQNDWYDFWTGQREAGARHLNASAPIQTLPLFVPAGSILPLGPVVQYADEQVNAPLEIRIYRGANGSFTMYDDEGDNYDYEKGKYSTIQLTWDNAAGILTIGARHGKFPGMVRTRTFNFVLVGEGHGDGLAGTSSPDATVQYEGKTMTVPLVK